jgi:capsular polysaccharide biosynthesis protein
MIDIAWNIDDEAPDLELAGRPRPLLGTWHYLSNALRRGWRTWAVLAILGAYAGLAAVVLLPPASTGTTTLLMAHPAAMDPSSAMSTDVSLLATREVAVRAVRELGLGVSPDVFRSTITAETVTPEVMQISVSAPDDRSAVSYADAVTKQYLAFRAEQLRSLTAGLVSGYQSRIATARQQVAALDQQYARATSQGTAGASQAADLLSRRADLNSQISTMQQASDDASLQSEAAISSTHVIEAARAVRPSAKKAMALDMGSGLIGGGALGVGLVLFRALTSDRLRRRQEIAAALGAPVRFSVGSVGPADRRRTRLWRRLLGRAAWRRNDLDTLVYGLESAIGPRGLRSELPKPELVPSSYAARVAVAAVGNNARFAAAVMATVAVHLRVFGLSIFLVDLSRTGALVDSVPRADAGQVFRPSGVPHLATGPRGARVAGIDLPVGHPLRESWDAADVVLVLVEVDPGIEVENLASWVDEVIPFVSAGRCTAELLETTAELIRASGLGLPFAMMVGADESDESLGLGDPRATPVVATTDPT